MAAPWRILHGDCREQLRTLPDRSVQTCVTSPPYFGLRDYGVDGQLGLEETPEQFVDNMVDVFREVHRVLRDDGTLWLNLGDSYAGGGRGPDTGSTLGGSRRSQEESRKAARARGAKLPPGLKRKDLMGMPWAVAFALRDDGWYLRRDIIWHKPNVTPECVFDRPTSEHEYLFLLTKRAEYFYDADAIKEPVTGNAHSRGKGTHPKNAEPGSGVRMNSSFSAAVRDLVATRNARSVWSIQSTPFPESHFATFPPELPRRCILAGTSEVGACPTCGEPYRRVLGEPEPTGETGSGNKQRQVAIAGVDGRLDTHLGYSIPWAPSATPTIAWTRDCNCAYAPPPPECCARSVRWLGHHRHGGATTRARVRRLRTERRIHRDGRTANRRRRASLQQVRRMLMLRPITLREANAFVAEHHAHHPPARGCKFAIACVDGQRLCGVVIVERPKARMLDDGTTLELSRVCTDRTPHAASKLIAAATRASFAMGARHVVSYVLDHEAGTSYRAAGWAIAEDGVGGGSWSRETRRRDDLGLFGDVPKAPQGIKRRWERCA